MSWSQAEVETILAQMQLGATAQTGGSRCHTTYGHRDGQWVCEAFDEGHIDVHASSEAQIRSLIASEPELFRHILRAVPWRRFSAAYLSSRPMPAEQLAGDREAAREHLREALAYGDGFGHGSILDAMLAWPETVPSEQLVELMREKLRDFTAYHVFMDAIGWDRSPELANRGLAYVEQLVEMVGETIGCHYLRATFHEQHGDLLDAERELLRELELLPEGHSSRSTYETMLARVRARISSSA